MCCTDMMRVLALVATFAIAGCATTTPNFYRSALTRQETCCSALTDPAARNACLGEISRVDNPTSETSAVNAETFRCVDQHFRCNPATGRATKDSAQEQLDCINDLESTKQMPRS